MIDTQALQKRIQSWLKHRYRLLVVDDASYQQTWYITFSMGRMLAYIVLILGSFWLFNTVLIVFTPIREYIPGYTDPQLNAKQSALLNRMELLERTIASRDSFIQNLRSVSGYVPADSEAIRKKIAEKKTEIPEKEIATGNTAKIGMTVPANKTLPVTVTRINNRLPFMTRIWPLNGIVTKKFDISENHFAVDLAARENASVLSMADGVVILAEFSAQTGYVIGIQHAAGLVSFYKHNGVLFKKVGAFVQAGEAIALVGNSGENSTGPHLHFEVWQHGQPVDPETFLTHTEN